jgi:putative flavoprotein involved in K+ transport
VNNGVAQFSGSLRNACDMADLKMNRLLKAIDLWVEEQGQAAEFEPSQRFSKTRVDEAPCLGINLLEENIQNVIWATGYRPDYSWLNIPVLDRKGMLKHQGGVVDAPGIYRLGMPFLRHRKSSYIHGMEDDARFVVDHLATYLEQGKQYCN